MKALLRITFLRSVRHASFGFQNVEENAKQNLVNDVFSSVAHRYDLMNDVMSLGIHRLWKDCFVKECFKSCASEETFDVLDIAGGTGDITKRIRTRCRRANVILCDINRKMMEHNGLNELEQVECNAENLPFNSNSFDMCTIAFGIRNCTHIDKVLDEAHRVLRPGGKFACLEFSRVTVSPLRFLYDLYSFNVIPVLGEIFASDYRAYRYLVESIRRFPDQNTFSEMMRHAGFCSVMYKNLSFGIAAMHFGFKKM